MTTSSSILHLHLLFLLLLLLSVSLPTCTVAFRPQLKQVHVITRHGARTTLPKNADTLLESVGSTLTPLGQKQLYDLGDWLRQTYYSDVADAALESYRSTLEFYNPSWHSLQSSGLDRTITSANSLSMGLFPLNAQVGNHGTAVFTSLLPEMPSIPVYTQKDSNDIVIRAYRNCPKFHQQLQDLYQTEPWKTLEINHSTLLTKLGQLFPDYVDNDDTTTNYDAFLPLYNIWNVYDPIHVARTECSPDPNVYACQSIENVQFLLDSLSDSEFDELELLMETTERMKFGRATAGNLLGSNLFWEIFTQNTAGGTFFLYSAHAPTILGFLSTIQQSNTEEGFVEYGSAMIVEFYQDVDDTAEDGDDYYVRFMYKSARQTLGKYLVVKDTMDCRDNPNNDETMCAFADVMTWASGNTLVSQEDWCTACDNTYSDVCMAAALSENNNNNNNNAWKEDLSEGLTNMENSIAQQAQNNPAMIAGSFFGGFFAGLLVMAILYSCCRRCCCSKKEKEKESVPTNDNDDPEQATPELS